TGGVLRQSWRFLRLYSGPRKEVGTLDGNRIAAVGRPGRERAFSMRNHDSRTLVLAQAAEFNCLMSA
ncbi:hypothetical protein, partial [Streptomyces sp. HPF1205]|uniref:hypothetical protein n=1 Tax=Streptomyces sp. HPF1205 TaxID=2873262 RepID=UPI001CECEF52